MYEQGGPSMARDIALVTLAVVLLTSYALGQNKCVFLTSETTDGAITENVLTGRVAANAICERLARSAGSIIPAGAQADPWRAWLSDSTVSLINDADGDVFIKGHPVNGEVERGSALSGSQIWFPVRLSI